MAFFFPGTKGGKNNNKNWINKWKSLGIVYQGEKKHYKHQNFQNISHSVSHASPVKLSHFILFNILSREGGFMYVSVFQYGAVCSVYMAVLKKKSAPACVMLATVVLSVQVSDECSPICFHVFSCTATIFETQTVLQLNSMHSGSSGFCNIVGCFV